MIIVFFRRPWHRAQGICTSRNDSSSSLLQRFDGTTSRTGPASPTAHCRRWVLHHDNAPAHTALSIREFLAKKNIPILPHPPYSPDLAPCDFYLFPKLKSNLKGHHFRTMENIQKIVTNELHTYGK